LETFAYKTLPLSVLVLDEKGPILDGGKALSRKSKLLDLTW
jgi:hypothetical protein